MALEKTNIRYLYIHRDKEDMYAVTLAMLMETGQYMETKMFFKKGRSMANYNFEQITSLFARLRLTKDSYIYFSEGFRADHPLAMAVSLVKQHIPFKTLHINEDRIVTRIAAYHNTIFKGAKASEIQKKGKTIHKIWMFLLRRKHAPWINEVYDQEIRKLHPSEEHKKKVIRLAIYYMFIKNRLMIINLRSKSKRIARIKQQEEAQQESTIWSTGDSLETQQ